MSSPSPHLPLIASFTTTLASAAHAEVARASLAVDAELSPERSTKALRVDGTQLVADFAAIDARNLRLAITSYVDMLSVVLRTLREFGDGA
jgi:hypothetical protein